MGMAARICRGVSMLNSFPAGLQAAIGFQPWQRSADRGRCAGLVRPGAILSYIMCKSDEPFVRHVILGGFGWHLWSPQDGSRGRTDLDESTVVASMLNEG